MSLIDRLQHRITQEDFDDQLIQVLKGESTRMEYNAAGQLEKKIVQVRHKDAALGLVVASALGLSDHGLAPTVIEKKDPDKEMYRRFAQPIDSRVVAGSISENPTPSQEPASSRGPGDTLFEALTNGRD